MNSLPRRIAGALALGAWLGGCATPPALPPVADPVRVWQTAELALDQGRRRYEEGRYAEARMWLDEALAIGLPTSAAAVRAHKLRAFLDCIDGQFDPCRAHFRAALEIDPNFRLEHAETGHPMWGPVFAEVRQAFAGGSR